MEHSEEIYPEVKVEEIFPRSAGKMRMEVDENKFRVRPSEGL